MPFPNYSFLPYSQYLHSTKFSAAQGITNIFPSACTNLISLHLFFYEMIDKGQQEDCWKIPKQKKEGFVKNV